MGRERECGAIDRLLEASSRGESSCLVLRGEAGIGKTALVRRFAGEAAAQARVLVGACDDLVTPRTLGPFRDMAGAQDAALALAEAVEPGAGREAVFAAVHQELAGDHGADAAAVLAVTAGNPFFVTEVLANPGVEVPATVRDAVLARLGGLSGPTQRALELLSTVPGQAERWLVERLLGDQLAALDEVERRGVLEADPGHVWFRHELARRAVERRLSSTARVACNRRVLAELARRPEVELSRLSHHAHQAGEPEAVVRHGLAAAREARWSAQLAAEQRTAVLEESVWVLYNLSRFDEAVARAGQVVRLAERIGEPARLGQALTTPLRMRYMVNDPAGSEEAVTLAVALLEPLSDQPRLARAYTYLAAILKLTDRPDEAIAPVHEPAQAGPAGAVRPAGPGGPCHRPTDQEHVMIYQEVRDLLVTQWTHTGGPNEAKVAECYHDDAVLEFPQSGERFEGKASFTAWRQQYPARLDFEPRELRGGGDLWVAETGLRYDGGLPVSVVKILQFRGDKIQRETLYFADPFPAPDWRRPFAAERPVEPRRGDLPAHIAAGQ